MGDGELKAAVKYDPATGHFTRLGTGRQGRFGVAGTINNNGYRLIRVGAMRFRAHRLAWLYVHGTWPAGEIDHINGVRDDNRIMNLRDVSNTVNQQNRRTALRTNAIGMLGVSSTKRRFKATIQAAGLARHLGSFDTPEAAHNAYLKAKRELHEGCTL